MKKLFVISFFVLILAACGGSNGGDHGGGDKGGPNPIDVTANIGGAEALFISSSSGSVLESVSPAKAVTVSSESPLFSITTSGVVGVLSAKYGDEKDAMADLPRLSYVAVSPIGHVILVFERPFIFTDTASDGTDIKDSTDPWSHDSGFTCQIFVVNKKLQNTSTAEVPDLTCLTTELEMNTWDFRSAIVQFDGDGGVYFTAHVPNNWKNVLLKWTPGEDDPDTDADESIQGTLTEVINANICFREFLVTNEGGVLYTGITSTNGDCGGTSFLRYTKPDGELQEITSGWWEYVFAPIETTTFAGSPNISPNITTENIGQILFYGPDPEIATTPDWDDACLFKFNPDAEGGERSIRIADCEIDMWRYIDFADDKETKKERCVEEKSMMGGGNIPEKILLADFNNDGSEYEVYVVGDIYEKKVGEWRYNFCINKPFCTIDGIPEHDYDADEVGCDGAGGTWLDHGECYHDQTNAAQLTELEAANDSDWQLNDERCQQPAGDWKETYSGFAWVIFDGDTRQIVRFSDDNEVVRNGWIVNNRLVYSSFNADDGQYLLREIVWSPSDGDDETVDLGEISKTTLLTGTEVYELFADPRSDHDGKWFFNGLRFEDNQYVTGTFDPDADDPLETLETEAEITGQIETLVIVPNF